MQTMNITERKRGFALFVAIMMALTLWVAVPLTASADTLAVNFTDTKDIIYHIPAATGDAVSDAWIVGYKGTAETLVIPDTLTVGGISHNVTRICPGAFAADASLKDVIIGNNIALILDSAFWGCTALTSVTISASVTQIQNKAFYNCTALTMSLSDLPATVTSKAANIFDKDVSVSIGSVGNFRYSITEGKATLWCYTGNEAKPDIPSVVETNVPVTEIGPGAFCFRTSLTSVDLPEYLTIIGVQAFRSCLNLTSINLPNGLTTINTYAFYECGLTSIDLPDSLVSIGEQAFVKTGLAPEVTVPAGVNTCGFGVFRDCADLTKITVSSKAAASALNSMFTGSSVTTVVFNKSIGTELPSYALYKVSQVTTVVIPEGVTTIGEYALDGCNGLRTITIPASVNSFKTSSFGHCENLEEIIILGDASTVSNNTFSGTGTATTKIWYYSEYTTVKNNWSPKASIMIKNIALEDNDGLTATSLNLDASDNDNKAEELSITYDPATNAEIGEYAPVITWASSNTAVATVTVDQTDATKGTVAAIANGTALITATVKTKSGVKTKICEVTVVPADAEPGDLYNLTVVDGKFDALNIAGAKMSIVADAAPSDQAFDEWEVTSGADGNFFENKNSATTILTMPAENITVRATYKTVYALTMVKGTDNLDVGLYAAGDVVSITAETPESGKVFDTWTSDPTGVVFTNANSSTTTFAMPPNPVTITATYKDAPPPPPAPTTYAVTVENGTGSASYEAGATVSITANAPADGKVFDTWTTSDGVTFADSTSASTTFTMPAKAITVTATYKDDAKDSDGDGVPDYVEEQEGTDPADSCDFKDTDEDGVPDYIETKDGTDPNDKNSFKDTNSDGIPDYVQEHPEPVTGTNGWAYGNGVWKFFVDSVAQTGWVYDQSKWYYLNASGIMQTGWVYDHGKWYYLSGNGAMKTGWVRTDGNWYYLAGNGAMAASKWFKDADGSWYYLSGNGKMLTGKQTIGGKAYTFKSTGVWVS